MIWTKIRDELIRRRDYDLAERERLLREGRLHDGYCPEMEQIHLDNAAWLKEIVDGCGYPTINRVGEEGAAAAWLIVQHAISRPAFMRKILLVMKALPAEEIDPRNLAYLEDRIRMYEGRPQLYGTQFDWGDDGVLTPVGYDDLNLVNERRRQLGLPSLEVTTDEMRRTQDFFPDPEFLSRHREKYRRWLLKTGWRSE